MFCRLLFVCLFKRSIALGVGVGLGLGIGLGLVLGLGLGVGLALGLGWVRFYMLQSQSARIKASLWRRIPRKNKRRQKILGNRPNYCSAREKAFGLRSISLSLHRPDSTNNESKDSLF